VSKLCNPVFFFGRCFNINDGPEGQQLQAHGTFPHVTDTRFIVIVSRQDLSEQKWIKSCQRKSTKRNTYRKK
jgi:hypothetical protein